MSLIAIIIFYKAVAHDYLKYYILVAVTKGRTKWISGVGRTGSVQYHRSFTGLQLLRNGIPFGVC